MTNNKKNPLLILMFLLGIGAVEAQQRHTINGTVKSKATGETLIGASITVEMRTGTATNEYGFYSLSIPSGTHTVTFSAMGLQSISLTFTLNRDTTINIQLEEASNTLGEVLINARNAGRSLTKPQMGIEHVSTKDIKNIPVLFGERDALKVIQLLPGIKSAGDGNSGFFVRGGAADQNLILLDEAPVYNASHLMGFFSTFNADVIKDISMYKGGMPAQYGGRLSSVMDIKMNEGNNRNYNVSGGVGLISAKLNIEGPIQRDQSSFLISGRRTYADAFLRLSNDSTINSNTLYFYDLNAKMNYILGEKDRLYVSGYFGQDKLGVGDGSVGLTWGNATGTLRWNHIFNNKLFSNTSLIFSNYDYTITIRSGASNFNIFSQIRDWNLKEELQWYVHPQHTLRVGFNSIFHQLRPGEVTPTGDDSYINATFMETRRSLENALYVSDNFRLSGRIEVEAGLRASAFSILGEGEFYNIDDEGTVTDTLRYSSSDVVNTYVNLEPRLALSYRVDNTTSLKASYARNVQNLHLLSNSTAASPTDKWIASTNIVKPEIADQVSIGYYKNLFDDQYELTVETYYKHLQNQIDYRDGADIFNNNAIETQLLFGKGRAYGAEFLVRKHRGDFTGWVSYTLSKTERQIPGINDGNWYNATQDRTHDLAIVAMYQLNPRWSLSANWVYNTGNAVSFPSGKYTISEQTFYYYTERNGYRMPAYHRLDLGAIYTLRKRKRYSSELAFSLYNAYGRKNAYTIEFRDAEHDPNLTEAVRFALFRFIPSISYNFKF